MAYVKLQQPLRGLTDVVSYRAQSSEYTKKCMNVNPFDVYENRLRIGSRQGFCALADFAEGGDASKPAIQGMLAYKIYRNNVFTQRILIVQNGKVFDCNSNGSEKLEVAQVGTENHFGDGSNPINEDFQPDTALSTTAQVEMVQYRSYAYLIDGSNYYQIDLSKRHAVSSNRIGLEHWSEEDSSGGQLDPDDSGGARPAGATLIAVWGARIVLAGFVATPNVWVASKVGEPNDWHAVADNAAGAIGGGTSPQYATLGDQITALHAFGSSGLLLGCRDSIAYMTTDPVLSSSASMELISREVGCLGPRSICGGPEKSVYFIGSDGVYVATPNDFDINRGNRISTGALDGLFRRTDSDDLAASVAVYNEDKQTLTVLLSRSSESFASVHATYDISTSSWWPFQIADSKNNNPTCAVSFKPLPQEKQVTWFAGPQGRISIQPTTGAFHSDGMKVTETNSWSVTESVSAFDSRLLIGPLNDDPSQRLMLRDIRVILQDNEEVLNAGEVTTTFRSSNKFPTNAQLVSGSEYPLKASYTSTQSTVASRVDGNIATIDVFDIEEVQAQDVSNATTVVTNNILSTIEDNFGAATSLTNVPGTSSSTIDGGAHNTSYSATERLYGIGAFDPSGTYLQLTDEANPVLFGPGSWVIYFDQSLGKWHSTYDGVKLFISEASSQLPSTLSDTDLPVDSNTSTLTTTGGVGNDAVNSLFTANLKPSINNALRTRVRSSDLFFQISASGRSWALEDISVDIVPGGPVIKVTS